MHKRYKRLVAGLVAGTVVLSTGSIAYADPALDDLNRRNQETRNKLDANKAQQAQLIAELNELDRKFVEMNNQLQALTNQFNQAAAEKAQNEQALAQIKAELQKTSQELAAAKQKLRYQQGVLNKRAEGIYRRGETSYMDVILNSKSVADFINRFSFLQMILGQDAKLVKKVEAAKDVVEQKERQQAMQKQQVEAKQAAIEAQMHQIAALQEQQAAQVRAVNAQKAQKDALMAQLKQDQAALKAVQAAEAREAEALKARISAASAKFASRGTARGSAKPVVATSGWVLPVGDAPITTPFGPRVAPTAGASTFHHGIDYAVPEGSPIVAANGGTVIDVGYDGVYGNLTIIDHGNGITSAYAHQSSFGVSVGQTVKAGQVIGYVGSTGLSTGPHLHFEIRVDGEAQNPLNWYGG